MLIMLRSQINTNIAPSFCCQGEVNSNDPSLAEAGYIKQRVLSHLIAAGGYDYTSRIFPERECELFGYPFDYYSAWDQEMETLLHFAQSSLSLLEQGAATSSVIPALYHSSISNFIELRDQLTVFLSYMNSYVSKVLEKPRSSDDLVHLCKQIDSVLRSLHPFVESIHFIPGHILSSSASSQGNKCLSGSYHYFHAHWDVRWALVQVLDTCCHQTENSIPLEWSSKLQALLQQIFEDLVYLALNKFKKLSNHEWASTSPFSCTCIRELWLMLEILLDRRASETRAANFWGCVKEILREKILEQNTEEMSRFSCSSPVVFALWLGVNLGKLDCYTPEGEFGLPNKRMEGDLGFYYPFIKTYLQSNASENDLRGFMALILLGFQVWNPYLNILLECLEFFSKRLNSNFVPTGSNSIDAYGELTRSSSGWLDKLSHSFDITKNLSGNLTSFSLFLRVLGYSIEWFYRENQTSDWRSIRGRLWLKCNAKRVQELSEVGLYHLFSLLLTLTLVADINEVANKISELVGYLPPMPSQKHWVGWSASLALLVSYVRRQQPMDQTIAVVNQKFGQMTRELQLQNEGCPDPDKRQFVIKATRMYIETLQDVFDASKALSFGQHLLLSHTLGIYMGACGNADQKFTLDVLKSIAQKIRLFDKSEDERAAFTEAFSKYVTPICKQLAWVSQTSTTAKDGHFRLAKASVSSLSELALELTLLWYSLNDLEKCKDIFTHFAYGEYLNTSVCAHYLSLLLDGRNFVPTLSLFFHQCETVLIKAWFRLALLVTPSDEAYSDLQSVQKVLIRLPEVAELFLRAEVNSRELNIKTFVSTLCKAYSTTTIHTEQNALRDQFTKYFGPVDKYLIAVVKKWEPASTVSHVYQAMSRLFRYGAPWLYVKGKPDCLFCTLTSQLVLPTISFDASKTLPQTLSSALSTYLKDFLHGFAALNLTDPYIRRCVKDVVLNYMHRFAFNDKHPLTLFYLENGATEQAFTPAQRLFLEIFKENCISKKGGQFSPLLNQALNFLNSLAMADRSQKVSRHLVDILGLDLLEILLSLTDLAGRKAATDLVQIIFHADGGGSDLAVLHLETIILRHLAFNSGRLFKLLETLTVMVPDIVRASLPSIEGEVSRTESKRGTGTDQALRHGLQKLKISLGAKM